MAKKYIFIMLYNLQLRICVIRFI